MAHFFLALPFTALKFALKKSEIVQKMSSK
jgi:hypothetical protein